MGDAQEIQLHIKGKQGQEQPPSKTPAQPPPPPLPAFPALQRLTWWLTVLVDVLLVIIGQTVATLLGRLYYNEGGQSKWMNALVVSAGSPLLVIFLLPCPSHPDTSTATADRPYRLKLAAIYAALGVAMGFDNLMYSYGLLYLPVSTYSLVCATQLAFNAVYAYFLNAQKFTALVSNSVVLLTFSAALLGATADSDGSSDVSKPKYPLGFALTLAASALFSLVLSLTELTFNKVTKVKTLAVVLELQIYSNVVASVVSVAGLFASGEWRKLHGEMEGYKKGKVAYVMTLAWTAVSWQVMSVGTLRLIAKVSSLFANVTGTLGLPLVPVFAVVFFHDRMTGVKVVAMLMAVWGFLSYAYQHKLDESIAKRKAKQCSCGGTLTDGAASLP